MYQIFRSHYYYAGTIGVPADDFVRDIYDLGEYLQFATLQEAQTFLETDEYMPETVQISDTEYRTDRDTLIYGQYGQDLFEIREVLTYE